MGIILASRDDKYSGRWISGKRLLAGLHPHDNTPRDFVAVGVDLQAGLRNSWVCNLLSKRHKRMKERFRQWDAYFL